MPSLWPHPWSRSCLYETKAEQEDALTFHIKRFQLLSDSFLSYFILLLLASSFSLELNESCKQHVGSELHLLSSLVKTAGVRVGGEGESAWIAV